MTPNAIIDRLGKYEYHDLLVKSVEFYSERDVKLIISTLPFDEKTTEYQEIKIIFSRIMELKTDQFFLDDDCEMELNSFDYAYNGRFNCRMVFLLGIGKPSFSIELKCGKIELDESKGLAFKKL